MTDKPASEGILIVLVMKNLAMMVKVVCTFEMLDLLAMEKIFVLTKAGLKSHTVGIRVPTVQRHLRQEKLSAASGGYQVAVKNSDSWTDWSTGAVQSDEDAVVCV